MHVAIACSNCDDSLTSENRVFTLMVQSPSKFFTRSCVTFFKIDMTLVVAVLDFLCQPPVRVVVTETLFFLS